MDPWVAGGLALLIVVLYVTLVAIGVLVGLGTTLVEVTGARGATDIEEMTASVKRASAQARALAGGRTVVPDPPRNRGERRAQARRRKRGA